MSTSLEKRKERALAVFDKPGNVVPHLNVANRLAALEWRDRALAHVRQMVPYASAERDDWLTLAGCGGRCMLVPWRWRWPAGS